MVAYFLSGPTGKNTYLCTSLTTHVCSYVCALTYFHPLPPMATCQVNKVKISRVQRIHPHSIILNTLCECVTQFFLFRIYCFSNTRVDRKVLLTFRPCCSSLLQDKDASFLCLRSASSAITICVQSVSECQTCSVGQVLLSSQGSHLASRELMSC